MEPKSNFGALISTLVVLVLLGGGLYYLLQMNPKEEMDNTEEEAYYVSEVQVKHQYKDGKHIYAGALDLPNACYSLDADINKNSTTTATLILMTNVSEEEMCAQVVTTRSFRVEVEGEATLDVTGTLNGRPVELNVFEVPAQEDIDSFEINVKA